MSQIQLLFASPLVAVSDHLCTARKGEGAKSDGSMASHLRLVRRGCFTCRLGARTLLADSSVAYLHDAAREHLSGHPCDGGDACTLIAPSPELSEEVFGPDRGAAFALSPVMQLDHLAVYAALKQGDGSRLGREELVLELMAKIARSPLPAATGSARQQRTVDEVKAMLIQDLDRNIELGELAQEIGWSPFHLMRVFRAHAGMTMRAYRCRLRVSGALLALAEGAEDLTQVALDFGFASHSHMTATFREVLGAPPSAARDRLAHGAVGWRRAA